MHDIKYIRDNFENFKKKISKRNNTTKIDNILDLDKKNRIFYLIIIILNKKGGNNE